MTGQEIVIVLAVIYWVISGLYRSIRKLAGGGKPAPPRPATPSRTPMPVQVVPPASSTRLEKAQQFSIQSQNQQKATAPRAELSNTPVPPNAPPPAPRRRPDAGGSPVPQEATSNDFQRQEQDLFTEEPAALNTPLTSDSPPSPSPAPMALFGKNDDMLRAFIMQEVLGPPLSRRTRHSPPAPAPESVL